MILQLGIIGSEFASYAKYLVIYLGTSKDATDNSMIGRKLDLDKRSEAKLPGTVWTLVL